MGDMKNDHCLVAKGNKNAKIFTLDAGIPKMIAAMFARGKGVFVDIDIWHKYIGHVNIQQLKKVSATMFAHGK